MPAITSAALVRREAAFEPGKDIAIAVLVSLVFIVGCIVIGVTIHKKRAAKKRSEAIARDGIPVFNPIKLDDLQRPAA